MSNTSFDAFCCCFLVKIIINKYRFFLPFSHVLFAYRNLSTENTKSSINKKVIGRTASGNTHILAELKGTVWSMMNSNWMLQIKKTGDEDKRLFELFELTGTRNVTLFFSIYSLIYYRMLSLSHSVPLVLELEMHSSKVQCC